MLLFLIFALIVVSGLIAYLGDQIGMKVGKKRLSIFGIRPRYTSIIITILTGIFIATISISLLLIALEDVRMAVFDMERLLAKLGDLSRQIEIQNGTLEMMKTEIHQKESEIKATGMELEKIIQDKEKTQKELDIKLKEYSELEAKLKQTEEELKRLAISKIELQEKIKELEIQKEVLDKENIALEKEKTDLEKDIEKMQEEVDKLAAVFNEMLLHAAVNVLQYQNKDIIYRKGDLVYMESLETIPQGTIENGKKVVEEFLTRANNHVAKYNLRQRLGRSIEFSNIKELEGVAEALVNSSYEKILVAIFAAKNILTNEFLNATISWQPNYLVFAKNEIIFEKEIDSNNDPSIIEKEITEILERVNEYAKKRGLFTDASGRVGSIEFSEFFRIIETITNLSGRVKITVQATNDIWREHILSTENLKFIINPVGIKP